VPLFAMFFMGVELRIFQFSSSFLNNSQAKDFSYCGSDSCGVKKYKLACSLKATHHSREKVFTIRTVCKCHY
jgi:hypothetical protein